MSSIQDDIETRLAEREPDVEVLLAEVLGGHTVRLFIDHPEGVTLALCERVTHALPEVRERYALEVSSPGHRAPADQARPLPPLPRPPRARAHARGRTTATSPSPASWSAPPTTRGHDRRRHRRHRDPVRRHPPFQPRRGVASMSREILEAMTALAREKGIAPEKLHGRAGGRAAVGVQEAARLGEVRPRRARPRDRRLPRHRADRARAPRGAPDRRDDRRGDLHRPRDRRVRRARRTPRSTRRSSRSTATRSRSSDVTPDDFGRIAAQTAKQVILQRIREAERDMMFEEYRDRVGELITGIVQQ